MKKFLLPIIVLMAVMFSACENKANDTISMATIEVTLNYEDTYQIQATSTSPNALTYTSQDEFHATVSETGLVTAGRVGETNIEVSDGISTKYFRVIVERKYELFPTVDIVLDFGISRSELISRLGTPDEEGSDYLEYMDQEEQLTVRYEFDTNDNLNTTYVIAPTIPYGLLIPDYLIERYMTVGMTEEDIFVLINGTEDSYDMTILYSVVSSSLCMIGYFPADYSSASIKSIDFSNEMMRVAGAD